MQPAAPELSGYVLPGRFTPLSPITLHCCAVFYGPVTVRERLEDWELGPSFWGYREGNSEAVTWEMALKNRRGMQKAVM